MPITLQCPNPACGVISPASDAVNGRTVRCKKCGTPFTAKPTFDEQKSDTKKHPPSISTNPFPALPSEFGRYRVLRLLGRGGMGAVYLAEDSTLGRQVALKLPFFDASESPQRLERFVREARSAAALQHPNICTVYDAGEIDGRPFIAMAYIAGKPLEDEIDPDAPMPQVRAAEITRKIALALDHAHGKGIVHRDLKPANVMLTADGEPVVMDFGLAKRFAESDAQENKLTREGGVLGTPSYMAPEQVRGELAAIGPATDVYALGVMLFEMLVGRTPYRGPLGVVMLQIQTAPVPPVQEFRSEVDSRLNAICSKAMAKTPAERFASMAEFADALGRCLKAPVAVSPPLAVPVAVAVSPAGRPGMNRSPFDEMTIAPNVAHAAKKVWKGDGAAKSEPAVWRRPVVLASVAAAAMLALLVLGAAGVFKVKTADGVLVVQVNEPNAEVFVDGDRMTVSWNDGGKTAEIHVKPGTRKVEVKKDGFSAAGKELTFKDGDREVFTVRLLADGPPMAKADAPLADTKKAGEPRVENAAAPAKTNPSKMYLYDLKEFDLVALGGRLRDGLDDKGIVVKGEKIKKGLEMHPLADKYASVKYKLDGLDATDFEAKVAINDTAVDGSASPLTFQVFGDGKALWASQPAQAPRQTQDCSVKVEGVHVLELRVVCAGDYRSAVAVWVDPFVLANKRSTTDKTVETTNSVGMRLKLIKPGKFLMGSPQLEEIRNEDEGPQHEVDITKAFYMGAYPVTKGQFAAFVKETGYQTEAEKAGNGFGYSASKMNRDSGKFSWRDPGFVQTDEHPVVDVSCNDAQAYCAWLSKKEGKTYDLPTEAEWEYACRAGTKTRFWCGDADDSLKGNANIADASWKEKCPSETWAVAWNDGFAFTSPVDAFKPNPWGLFDMHGNVWQWCADGYGPYPKDDVKDPKIDKGQGRVLRGGAWDSPVIHCRSAKRFFMDPTYASAAVGFRVVMRQPGPTASQSPALPKLSDDLDKQETDDKGWVPLFNGKDLTGWVADGDCTAAEWNTDAGDIAIKGGPQPTWGWLLTKHDYTDFVLRLQFQQMTDGAKSGVVIRGEPGMRIGGIPYQCKVNLQNPENTGAVLWSNNSVYQNPPRPAKLKPAGEWNNVEIELRGQSLRVMVNGEALQTLDLDDFAGRPTALPVLKQTSGRIGLQKHSGSVRFRNIEIKELSEAKNKSAPATRADEHGAEDNDKGFTPLFNGKDLRGWKVYPSQPGNWRVFQKAISGSQSNPPSALYTGRADYTDFHLRFEARLLQGWSQVNLRAPFGPVLPANRDQLLSPSNPVTWAGGYRVGIGSDMGGGLYIDTDPKAHRDRAPQHKPGEWTPYEVIAENNHIVVKVNGETTCDYTDEKGLHTKGHIAFQFGDANVEFRKIEIKKLTPAKNPPPRRAAPAIPFR